MTDAISSIEPIKIGFPLVVLAALWTWESIHPFFQQHDHRLRHAARNLGLTVFNKIVISLTFGAATVLVADWTAHHSSGLLNWFSLAGLLKLAITLVLLDLWMYLWHRANHAIPLLWRFHRMHHSDHQMDVTTATRFHVGELAFSTILRLGLIPVLGFDIWHIVIYDLLVSAFTQFHHANISLGRLDRWMRLIIVTPDMHKVHHSRIRAETDSNYSVVLSVWDRIARSFRTRRDPQEIVLGIDGLDGDKWQGFFGLLTTPFRSPKKTDEAATHH